MRKKEGETTKGEKRKLRREGGGERRGKPGRRRAEANGREEKDRVQPPKGTRRDSEEEMDETGERDRGEKQGQNAKRGPKSVTESTRPARM